MPNPYHSSRFYHPHNIGWADFHMILENIILVLTKHDFMYLDIKHLKEI
jgi:hypothetical protein